ncbi:MAG: glycosyltransferase family 4 protein [Planctomycetes bacterium]|nr:glycosyltransferase family 4 protein [Planctomycetota bacterium]
MPPRWSVDAFWIQPDSLSPHRILVASGWCLSTGDAHSPGVVLRCNGEVHDGLAQVERPDVRRRARGMHVNVCGFRGRVFVTPEMREFDLVLADSGIVIAAGTIAELERRFPARSMGPTARTLLRIASGVQEAWRGRRAPDRGTATDDATSVADRGAAGDVPRSVVLFAHNLNLEGATMVLVRIAEAVRTRQDLSPMVVSFVDGPARARLAERGVSVSLLPAADTTLAGGWRGFLKLERTVAATRRALAAHRPSLVIVNTLESFCAVNAAHRLGAPVIWLIHEHYSPDVLQRVVARVALPAMERALKRADRVVFVSEETRELFAHHDSGGRFVVCPNTLDEDPLASGTRLADRESSRRSLGIEPGDMLALSVGTICSRKDQTTLVESIRILADRCPNVRAVLVGLREGEPFSRVIEENVRRPGIDGRVRLVRESIDVDRYYRAADVFVLSSRIESCSLAVLEAMGHGLPIVTTLCGGVREQVRIGENALSFEFGDAAQLARHLEILFRDGETRRRMGERSRARFLAWHKPEESRARYLDLIESVLTGRDADRGRTRA